MRNLSDLPVFRPIAARFFSEFLKCNSKLRRATVSVATVVSLIVLIVLFAWCCHRTAVLNHSLFSLITELHAPAG